MSCFFNLYILLKRQNSRYAKAYASNVIVAIPTVIRIFSAEMCPHL